MLTVITAERLISIVFSLRISRLTLRGAYLICAATWICGVVIASVPAFGITYFYNKRRKYGFYGTVFPPIFVSKQYVRKDANQNDQ